MDRIDKLSASGTTQAEWLASVEEELRIAEERLNSAIVEPQEVLEHHVAAALMAQRMDDHEVAAMVACNHGAAAMKLARYKEAVRCFGFALQVFELSGDRDIEQELAIRGLLRKAQDLAKSEGICSRPRRGDQENAAETLANEAELTELEESPPNICAICLRSEAELGKSLPWVLRGCGHRCFCKSCLRKLKAHTRKGTVECPICRTHSKPILSSQWNGRTFSASED